MPRKSFFDDLNKTGSTPKKQSENVANAMYGGEKNTEGLNAFFEDLGRSGNELARFETADDGQITIGNFRISTVGLQIADGVDADEWQSFGQHIRMMETSLQWIIGDWLAYGERLYGKTYQEVAELTGYTYGTLQNWVWVARSFNFSSRDEKLTYTHHQKALVACSGDVDLALQWLARALENGWSIRRMIDEIEGNPPTPPLVSSSLDKFWRDFEGFSKKHTQIAGRVGEAERRQMADALRKLADDLERTKK